jgi:hypothetical protein
MAEYKVVEKNNPLALHLLTYSIEAGNRWIQIYGDSKMFMDKSLTKESFIVKLK